MRSIPSGVRFAAAAGAGAVLAAGFHADAALAKFMPQATAGASNYSGHCPGQVTFSGHIIGTSVPALWGPGTNVTYAFVYHDPGSSAPYWTTLPSHSATLGNDGTAAVSDTGTVTHSGTALVWLQVTSPGGVNSNTVSFSVNCAAPLDVEHYHNAKMTMIIGTPTIISVTRQNSTTANISWKQSLANPNHFDLYVNTTAGTPSGDWHSPGWGVWNQAQDGSLRTYWVHYQAAPAGKRNWYMVCAVPADNSFKNCSSPVLEGFGPPFAPAPVSMPH